MDISKGWKNKIKKKESSLTDSNNISMTFVTLEFDWHQSIQVLYESNLWTKVL